MDLGRHVGVLSIGAAGYEAIGMCLAYLGGRPIHKIPDDAAVFAAPAFFRLDECLALRTLTEVQPQAVARHHAGKTLPRIRVKLGTLYAVNTFGAVSGVLVTGFFLIGRYGIHVPVYLAIMGNLLIGGLAWWVSTRIARPAPAGATPTDPGLSQGPDGGTLLSPGTYRLILFGLGLSGFFRDADVATGQGRS